MGAEPQDIFLRAHAVRPRRKARSFLAGPQWPRHALIFDTETTIDTEQTLKLGAFRRCVLVGATYACTDEGLFYGDDCTASEQRSVQRYVRSATVQVDVASFPPRATLSVYSRDAFLGQVFWKAIKRGDLIVGLNLPFDLARLAVKWSAGKKGGWSLVFSMRRSRKTGKLEPNPHRPRIRITARDSKGAFISLTRPHDPEEWPKIGRFLDLRTLGFALFGAAMSLKQLCKSLKVKGKRKHEPTGRVTPAELAYCLDDARATTRALNGLKAEFDRHPLPNLQPDRVASPAGVAMAYVDAMGVQPPKEKFRAVDRTLGIAMQGYYGGRCECHVRRTEVPVVHVDFTSQFPSANALLGNWQVLTAASVEFENATARVRRFLRSVSLEQAFRPRFWRQLSFFALVQPDDDILPVRAMYNHESTNIGLNHLTSRKPIWFAGPDVVASILLRGKVPRILKAIRMSPRGTQRGLRSTSLRGALNIDPRRHDFFRYVVEQRQPLKKTNKPLADFLKTLANAGSYGKFVEVNPGQHAKPVTIRLFAGDRSRRVPCRIVEEHGRWYFPPIATLITAGGRLLLAMLERCVTDADGTYLFCDTDALCIVASQRRRFIACEGGPHQVRGQAAIRTLSWQQVRDIAHRFDTLNPYQRQYVPSFLKIEDINFDARGRQRQLFGFGISAKRYVLYEKMKGEIVLVDPKAHGLGYLYSPIDSRKQKRAWTWQAWLWMLRDALNVRIRTSKPAWLDAPAMMRVSLSTPMVLQQLNRRTRPFSFLFCPLIDRDGYPAGIRPSDRFTLIAPFSKRRSEWLELPCWNIYDGRLFRLALEQTLKGDRVIPQTYGSVLRAYLLHPEAKSLAPDGAPCRERTSGVLRRGPVLAAAHRAIQKETDRRAEQGEHLSLMDFRIIEYGTDGGMVRATLDQRRRIRTVGRRPLMRRTGLSQHTLEKIERGQSVRRRTLQAVLNAIPGE
jgi:hypothetical protein